MRFNWLATVVLTLSGAAFAFNAVGCAHHATRPDQKGASGQVSSHGLIPLRDFFRNPRKSDFELSPDGRDLAYLAPWQHRMNVFMRPVDSSTPVRLTDVTDRDISDMLWKGNHTILFLRDFKGDENFQLFSVDTVTKKVMSLTPFSGVRTELVDDLNEVDDDHVLIGLNKRDREIFDVYRLNIRNGKLNLVAKNPGHISGWMTDHNGHLKLAVKTDGVNNTILVRESEREPFHELLTTDFRTEVSPLFYTFDNKNVYALSNRGRDKLAVVKLDLKTGKEHVIYARHDVDISNVTYSKRRHVLWDALYTTWKMKRHFFDPVLRQLFLKLKRQIPSAEIGISSYDKAEDKFVVLAWSDVNPGSEYLYDSTSDKVTKLADTAPWINPAKMSPMKPIEYTARDGLKIHGYLTVPRGMAAKDLPVVVNPHGGPSARDSWGYNPEVQFLASRGYAVLQMNFRGSTGYGRRFWEASFKQWGRKMQNDVTDGVKWLIKKKIADSKRVAIYGGSYGGYATLAGVTFTPHLYACGVDYVGVSNLLQFMQTIPPYWKPFLEMMYTEVGNPTKDAALLRAESPVFHADQIRVPLFVAQGAKDPRVNIAESNQIVAALKNRGIDVEYMVKQNEGHGFQNEENRFDFYTAMQKFLAKYLKPTPPTS